MGSLTATLFTLIAPIVAPVLAWRLWGVGPAVWTAVWIGAALMAGYGYHDVRAHYTHPRAIQGHQR